MNKTEIGFISLLYFCPTIGVVRYVYCTIIGCVCPKSQNISAKIQNRKFCYKDHFLTKKVRKKWKHEI